MHEDPQRQGASPGWTVGINLKSDLPKLGLFFLNAFCSNPAIKQPQAPKWSIYGIWYNIVPNSDVSNPMGTLTSEFWPLTLYDQAV